MNPCSPFVLLAEYNQWMNEKLYETAGRLSAEGRAADRGAYFGSVMGTLNHILGADSIWLHRFRAHPARFAVLDEVLGWPLPEALDQQLFTDFDAMREHRGRVDRLIREWVGSLSAADLDTTLSYRNMKGVAGRRLFSGVLLHFFNHQAHHRGQATTLLTQAGQDVGITDLLMLVPNEAET